MGYEGVWVFRIVPKDLKNELKFRGFVMFLSQ